MIKSCVVFLLFFISTVCTSREVKFISQKGQDRWIIEEVFKRKKKGYFVDCGASDGVGLSNTYLLEKKFGWTGVCIEPNPFFFEQLRKNRSVHLLNTVIDYTNHVVSFRIDNGLGGGIVDVDTDNNYSLRGEALRRAAQNNQILKIETCTLEQVLDQVGAPKVIDFLSLDVEGAETRVFKNFPFYKYTFLAMTIERPSPELNQLLFKNGYIFVKNSNWDSFYVHESLKNQAEIRKKPFKQTPKKNR